MSELFPLSFFPQGSLESSVITTVWVGVFVVAFFNLRFGWVLSGLVVPGYLVPLIILKPWSASVILAEAFITFFIVRILSDECSKLGYWSKLFGRDRFFAIILVSIAVRLCFDGWLLPIIGDYLENNLKIAFDYRTNLHSFGLVIIALIANQMWNTGFLRGLPPLIVTIMVTFVLVRYGLMEFTNFTISNLTYMYEDLASSILATPKAYIILLTAAFIASRMNLYYGWDYNGILIPSLLALQWYQPFKILTSFFEAFLILGIAILLLKLPWFAKHNIEGARKLLLFFNIGFIYKLLLAYFLLAFFPEIKVTDGYAFGYMLATLMAIKMHDKDIAARLTRATLQTSVVAVVIGSCVGFIISVLPLENISFQQNVLAVTNTPTTSQESLYDIVRKDKIKLYKPKLVDSVPAALSFEIHNFSSAIQLLISYSTTNNQAQLSQAAGLLQSLQYQVMLVEERFLYIKENKTERGWGSYIIAKNTSSQLLIEVPSPLEERNSLDAALVLFDQMNAKALAFAGSRRSVNVDGSADVLSAQNTLFHAFQHQFSNRNILQVRGYTKVSSRVLAGLRPAPDHIEPPQPASKLWVKARLPADMDLVAFKKILNEININWNVSPFPNRLRRAARSGFAELMLNKHDFRKILAFTGIDKNPIELQTSDQRIDGYLQEWLLKDKNRIAGRGTNLYIKPRIEELLYFDDEIITPLWNAMQMYDNNKSWSAAGQTELRNIARSAAVMDYRILQYHHQVTGENYLILAEDEATNPRRYWGTYVFRLSKSNDYLVQVPRPLYEINSFEYAVALFERLKAKALLIAGTNPKANLDSSADIVRIANKASLFSLINQVVVRERQAHPLMLIHSRAFGPRPNSPMPHEDILLALRNGKKTDKDLGPLTTKLLETLSQDGFNTRLVDGSPQTAGYEVASIPQSLYLNASINKEFAILWVSPVARASYRAQSDDVQEKLKFESLGITSLEVDLFLHLSRNNTRKIKSSAVKTLTRIILQYISTQDIVSLHRMQKEFGQFTFERIIDRDSRQSFLIVKDARQNVYVIANLSARQQRSRLQALPGRLQAKTIRRFVEQRVGLLTFGTTQ